MTSRVRFQNKLEATVIFMIWFWSDAALTQPFLHSSPEHSGRWDIPDTSWLGGSSPSSCRGAWPARRAGSSGGRGWCPLGTRHWEDAGAGATARPCLPFSPRPSGGHVPHPHPEPPGCCNICRSLSPGTARLCGHSPDQSPFGSSPPAVVTEYRVLGLKQQKCMVSQLWRLKV